MISLKNVCYRYAGSEVDALHDISINFADASLTAVMGANGSGKSTLARSLNGLLAPTSGEVLVGDATTADPNSLPIIRRKVGFVFQDPNLQMTSATVERELAFGLQNIGAPLEEIREKVERELRQLNLLERRHVAPSLLSGGEKLRLALAAVLLLQPEYLVLDETTSFLSPSSRKQLMRRVFELRDSHSMTIILITQFFVEAMMAERLIILDKSRIACDAPPTDALSYPERLTLLGISLPATLRARA